MGSLPSHISGNRIGAMFLCVCLSALSWLNRLTYCHEFRKHGCILANIFVKILLHPTPASCHRGLPGVGEDTVELCVNERISYPVVGPRRLEASICSVGRPLHTNPPFICPHATTNLGALCEVARDNIMENLLPYNKYLISCNRKLM